MATVATDCDFMSTQVGFRPSTDCPAPGSAGHGIHQHSRIAGRGRHESADRRRDVRLRWWALLGKQPAAQAKEA